MIFNYLKVVRKDLLRISSFDVIVVEIGKGNAIKWRTFTQKHLDKGKKFTETVLLPKTSFPLRLDSTKRLEMDSFILSECKFSELYDWQRKHKTGPEFILHDGPPYANGIPHIGHAINKILKDITIRQRLLQGCKVHYVSGWDCHGLPIELKAMEAFGTDAGKLSPLEIRQKAREFARKAIEEQMNIFQSWGIMTNWSKSYFTFSKEYIKNQLQQFLTLYEMGLVYRDMKPVFWSPSSRTALAEAELEYNENHRSTAVVIGFPIIKIPEFLNSSLQRKHNVSALIWTTTPWTLPANQAVCYNPNISYCLACTNDETEVFILAAELLEPLQAKLGKQLKMLNTFPGDVLKNVQYSHPMVPERHLKFLPGAHVTVAKGTGLVHTAPAHGPDDFCVGLANQIQTVSLVNDDGCYNEDAGTELEGLPVLGEGNTRVLQMLQSVILHSEEIVHSYPYDWRTKQPVILRASKQWFIDTNAIKSKALELLQNVKILPQHIGNTGNLHLQLNQRPYWCISRQRAWGVPIPVLYNKINGNPVISRSLIDHYNDLLEKHGPDYWWTLPEREMAPDSILEPLGLTSKDVEKGKVILVLKLTFLIGVIFEMTQTIQ